MKEQPQPTVGIYNWGRKGWRVSVYQPAAPRDWNAIGHRLYERFCRTEKQAKKLAAELAETYRAKLL